MTLTLFLGQHARSSAALLIATLFHRFGYVGSHRCQMRSAWWLVTVLMR